MGDAIESRLKKNVTTPLLLPTFPLPFSFFPSSPPLQGETKESPRRNYKFSIAGGVYEGEWSSGLPHGKGIYIAPLINFEGKGKGGFLLVFISFCFDL